MACPLYPVRVCSLECDLCEPFLCGCHEISQKLTEVDKFCIKVSVSIQRLHPGMSHSQISLERSGKIKKSKDL